jgi:hypothetical protein
VVSAQLSDLVFRMAPPVRLLVLEFLQFRLELLVVLDVLKHDNNMRSMLKNLINEAQPLVFCSMLQIYINESLRLLVCDILGHQIT